MISPTKKLLSIVVPVFNEESNVQPLYDAVSHELAPLSDRYEWEFVFTDNHSTDETFALLERLAALDPQVRVLRFSRNFGHQRSILAAYAHARGDAAIQIDCDLQDPPELIPPFVALWEEGYKVVFGVRQSRKERWWLNGLRKLFYRFINLLSDDHLPLDAGDFRLIDRQVREELSKVEDDQPYLRGSIASMGFEQVGVPYERRARERGESKIPLGAMIRMGIDGVLNHSLVPLRLATYTALAVSAVTILVLVAYLIGKAFFGKDWPPGFATTTVLILLSMTLNALFLGIIGEYVGRIYRQIKKRPSVIVERELNPRDR